MLLPGTLQPYASQRGKTGIYFILKIPFHLMLDRYEAHLRTREEKNGFSGKLVIFFKHQINFLKFYIVAGRTAISAKNSSLHVKWRSEL
jgi:hypothetical protein